MRAGGKTSRLFDVSKYTGKAAVKAKALEALAWVDEYEDEYDDSFDDLAPGTRAGETEREGARTPANGALACSVFQHSCVIHWSVWL